MKVKKSKHYYEYGRNGYTPSDTWQEEVIEDKDNKWSAGEINPKMKLNKDQLGLGVDYSKDKIPNYYIGKYYHCVKSFNN